MTTVGFAGLCRMGAPMAINIARAGFPLILWNRSPEKAEAIGIAPHDAYRVIERSAAPVPAYRKGHYLDEAANPVSFALSLAGKDLGLALDGGRDTASMLNYRRSLR